MISKVCRTMSTQVGINKKNLIAVCQLTSKHDLTENFKTCSDLVCRAAERNCKMVFFPECFDYIGRNRKETIEMAYDENSEYMRRFRELAKKHKLWLSLGGFHNAIIDDNGNTRSRYHKLHLFDLEIPNKVRLIERKLGLSICYDVRFPELALWNHQKGAEILSYPSSFTVSTGLAHWEVGHILILSFFFKSLLRARAIETQSYVVAAAQTGTHNEKRTSYGHSMVVDPWGAVIAQFEQNQKFAEHTIPTDTIFYQSGLSYAFVNLKPIVPGHVLVSPIRVVEKFSELSSREVADLFGTVQKVQKMLEKYYNVNSSNISMQDGKDAGQTVKHVHVHILPRKKEDLGSSPDQIYIELSQHEKDRKSRNLDEMKTEAAIYKPLMHKT